MWTCLVIESLDGIKVHAIDQGSRGESPAQLCRSVSCSMQHVNVNACMGSARTGQEAPLEAAVHAHGQRDGRVEVACIKMIENACIVRGHTA